jgi:uncharacterized FlgJ-related protein
MVYHRNNLVVAVGLISFVLLSYKSKETIVVTKVVEGKKAVVHNHSSFSPEVFYDYVKKCGIKFPHIAFAQAILESGNFTSNRFRKTNNAFGMKVARSRPTTCSREHTGHAYYDDWRLSVQDYALYQAAYMRKARTEDEYYDRLDGSYAGDPTYVEKVRAIADKFKSE